MTSPTSEWPKSGLTLTNDEHVEAAELIDELQDRWQALLLRGDEHVQKAIKHGYRRPENFEPDTYTIDFGGDKITLKQGQGGVTATHNGYDVLRIYQGQITLVHLERLSKAMVGVRQYMVLDDLASI